MNYEEILDELNQYYNLLRNETLLPVKEMLVDIIEYLTKLLSQTEVD